MQFWERFSRYLLKFGRFIRDLCDKIHKTGSNSHNHAIRPIFTSQEIKKSDLDSHTKIEVLSQGVPLKETKVLTEYDNFPPVALLQENELQNIPGHLQQDFQQKETELQSRTEKLQQELQQKDTELKSKIELFQQAIQQNKIEQQNKTESFQQTLQQKEMTLQAQNKTIIQLQQEYDLLHAKYLTKLAASDTKKKNLAAYYAKQEEIRKSKSIPEQLADIIGKGDKWLPHSSTEPKSNKIGKPKGSHGAGRPRPVKIHGTIDLHVHQCTNCGADLKDVPEFIAYSSILTELYREQEDALDYQCLKLKNMEQRHYRKKCPCCGRWNYPQLGLLKNARFGLSFVTYVISKRIETSLPYYRIIGDLIKTFGKNFALSVTSIIDWFLKFEDQLKAMYVQLAELLKKSAFMHIDESGLPMKGENWWMWILCSANIMLYQISASRGHESVEPLLEGFKGTIIADFFRAYDKLDQDQQKCLAHLLSAIIEIIVGLKKENDRIEKAITQHEQAVAKEQTSKDSETKKTPGRPAKDQKLSNKDLEMLLQRKMENLKTLNQAGRLCTFFRQPFQETAMGWKTPQKDRMTAEQAQEQLMQLIHTLRAEGITDANLETLIKRCEKYRTELFTYLNQEGIPPDNNKAERGLRKYAGQRKVSGDFKNPELMEHYAIYLSLHMTCQANGKDFDQLVELILTKKSVDLDQFLFGKVQ